MRKISFFTLICLVLVFSFSAAKEIERDPLGRPAFHQGLIYLKVKEGISPVGSRNFGIASLDKKLEKYQVESINKSFRENQNFRTAQSTGISRIYDIRFSGDLDVKKVARDFSRDSNVEYAEPVPIMYMHAVPNDTRYSECQHLPQIIAELAWDIHKGEDGAEEVIIGDIDSGVDWKHPDLVQNVWQNLGEDVDGDGQVIEFIDGEWVFDSGDVNGIDDDGNGFVDDFIGWDFVNSDWQEDNDPTPEGSTHGTHVGGIAAGVTNNAEGIASISWNVKLLSTKHDKDGGNAYESDTYEGILYAAENGADVINTSWGCYFYSRTHEEILEYVTSLGSIMVSSAGNADWELPGYPSSYPNVVSVASVARNDQKAYYSCYGISVDVAAPGGDAGVDGGILSTVVGGGYSKLQGTSMAAPVVTGLIGLIKSYHPDWSSDQVVMQLIGTCDAIDSLNPGYEKMLGAGRINAYRALSEDNVNIPQELRLELQNVFPSQYLAGGETVALNLEIRNYAHFVSTDNLEITLSTNDPEIILIDSTFSGAISSDSYASFDNAFQIQVSEDASFHNAEFTLHFQADVPITYGEVLTFELPVNPGSGVLVWENETGGRDMSGTFIYDFLESGAVPVVYASSFDYPASFAGFDAVFLSFGSVSKYPYYDEPPNFDDELALLSEIYLENGGNLYIEGNDAIFTQADTAWLTPNLNLLDMLGLESAEDGVSNSVDNLLGQEGAITAGMEFIGSTQSDNSAMDIYIPNDSGIPAFMEQGYGVVAVQNEGDLGQRAFCSSYSMSKLLDGDSISTRENLLSQILTFFDVNYLKPQFETDYNTGHATHTVHFSDLTFGFPEANSWAWDFDNDGNFDSYEQNPEWTYQEPGIYTVTLQVSNDSLTNTLTCQDYVHIFDGESAILFDEQESHGVVASSSELNLTNTMTLEAWIKPSGWGTNTMGFGRILDKQNFALYLIESGGVFNDHSMALRLLHESGAPSMSFTDANSIQLDQWQHVAAIYDGSTNVAKIYINGVEQVISQTPPPLGNIKDNEAYDLFIGNNSALNLAFQGVIDEVRLWNIVRTPEEIEGSMGEYLSGNEEGLVAYWKMNEGNGEEIYDDSGNGNLGYLESSQWRQGTTFTPSHISNAPKISVPANFVLYNNYPNPFNPSTTISFQIPQTSKVSETFEVYLRIYDISGKLIKTLMNGEVESGYHSVVWDGRDETGRDVSSGVYFYKLEAGNNYSKTKKMLLLK